MRKLNEMHEGSSRVEARLEDLTSRVKRLESKEEQDQARQGRLASQPESAKSVTILQRGKDVDTNANKSSFVGVVNVV